MSIRTVTIAFATVALGAAVLAGCGDGQPAPTVPSAPPSSASPPGASAAPDIEAVIAESVAFRRQFGLRADEAWVRQVASDPNALWSYQVPLTAAEEADLDARAAATEQLAPILEDYGAQHRDEYAGLYIDQERGGVLVVLFTANLQAHGEAISRLVRPGIAIELREAPQSEADLDALMERVSGDEALPGIGVFVVTASADQAAGVVDIGVSTERGDVQGLITGRYGPAVRVTVLDPTGAFLKPRGTIVGRLVDAGGRGIQGAVGSEPQFADIPMDSIGPPETNPDGTFRLENQLPGRWRLTGFAEGYAESSVEVDVPPGGLATVEIVLRPS
jgi:hypothetical protein